MYAGSKYESHYTVWTAWISIRVRVRVRFYFILLNLAPPGTTVHVPTADSLEHRYSISMLRVPWGISGHRALPDSRLYRDVMDAFDLILDYILGSCPSAAYHVLSPKACNQHCLSLLKPYK